MTEKDVNAREIAVKNGWSTDKSFLKRVGNRIDVILKRIADCFHALSEQELVSYLKGHDHVAHLSPSMHDRQDTVNQLIELRLPPPELSPNPSKRLCSTLYGSMTK